MTALQAWPINPNLAHLPRIIPLDVEVAACDIETGLPEACTGCPIALAIIRAVAATGWGLADGSPVMVDSESVTYISKFRAWYSAKLPAEAQSFIQRFDRPDRGPVQPFRFHIDLVWM